MRGFLKRDCFLLWGNLGFNLCFVVSFGILAVFTDFSVSLASLYLVIMAASSIMSLFGYDERNGWEGYAAAVPNGRRAMVDARYVLTLLLGAAVMAIQFLFGLLAGEEVQTVTLLYGGGLLLYGAVLLPVNYRFGGTRGRLITTVTVLCLMLPFLGAVIFLAWQDLKLGRDMEGALAWLERGLLLAGLAAMGLSWPVSRRVMSRKEL